MPDQLLPQVPESTNSQYDSWFSDLLDFIKSEHFILTENIASPEQKKFYDEMISGDVSAIFADMRKKSSRHLVKNLLFEYLEQLKAFEANPRKLALALSDSKILVWAEIEDGDEKSEDGLLLAEAKVNASHYPNGFHVYSTIVETSDSLSVPSHYQIVAQLSWQARQSIFRKLKTILGFCSQ